MVGKQGPGDLYPTLLTDLVSLGDVRLQMLFLFLHFVSLNLKRKIPPTLATIGMISMGNQIFL